jgi:hypothetical protein
MSHEQLTLKQQFAHLPRISRGSLPSAAPSVYSRRAMLVTNDLACSRLACRAALTAASSGDASDSTAPSLQQQQQAKNYLQLPHTALITA